MGFGLDNIAMTLASAALTHALMFLPGAMNYLVPIVITPLIIAFAYRKRALTIKGISLAVILDLIISVSLGNFGFTVLITFFIGSIGVDKLKKHYKKKKNKIEIDREKRGDCRDGVQVLSNGLVASLCALAYLFTSNELFVFAFIGALAEAFADTAASGIGFMSKSTFDPFRFERCEKGISGGVSPLGTLAALMASFVVSLVAFAFGEITVLQMLLISASAFLGAVFDSFLGSLFQAKYKCPVCSAIVEKEMHCDTITEKYRGIRIVTNDLVNLLSTLFSATVSAVLLWLL